MVDSRRITPVAYRSLSSIVRSWLVVASLCLALGSAASAQTQLTAWGQPNLGGDPKAILQAANSVSQSKGSEVTVLLDEAKYTLDAQRRETQTLRLVYRIENAEGVENWGNIGANWEPWHQERPQINARVIGPDGAVYKLNLKDMSEVAVNSDDNLTFSEIRRYHGPLPGVSIGSVVEEEFIIRDTAPFFAAGSATRSYMGRSVPVERSRVIVEVPASLPLHYAVHLLPAATVKKEDVAGIQRLTVEMGRMEAQSDSHTNLPTDRPSWPHVDYSTADSWKSINDAYLQLVEASIHVDQVKGILPALDKNASRDEIVRATVAKLHSTIRYTGVEFGESGLVPQSSGEILKRKFGDCKEKAALLIAMLRAQRIPANLALLVSNNSQDAEAEIPGMGIFDHAIVVIKGQPDLWIDATAEYTPVGSLPGPDQGRAALIVREGSDGLVATPEFSSASNVSVEQREFHLADFGPARVIETTTPAGDYASTLRRMYPKEMNKDSRKSLEDYMETTYLAEKVGTIKSTDAADLTHPFQLVLESPKAKRGFTDEQSSLVAVPITDIFLRLPKELRTRQEEDENEKKTQAGKELAEPRTLDFVLQESFIHEWRYNVVPPSGFRVHGLPSDTTIAIGPAKLTETFKAAPDNTVQAVFRFDTVKKRYTAEESRQIRQAILKLADSEMMKISFEDSAAVLVREGKIREGLAEYRQLVSQKPKEGLRRAKLARALLEVGLGDAARTEAREAVKLEPDSAYAFRTLAWILQHDLIGRRLQRGFDREGSIVAYRKALQLDPTDNDVRGDLGILLEHDSNGERYVPTASLKEAVAVYREIKTKDKENHNYDEHIAYDLIYSGDLKQTREFLAEIGTSTVNRRGIEIAAVAAQKGAEAALQRASEVSSNDSERVAATFLAGRILMNMRRYPEAAALMQSSNNANGNAGQVAALVEMLKRTTRAENLAPIQDAPSAFMQKGMIAMMTSAAPEAILAMSSKNALDDGRTDKERLKEASDTLRKIHTSFRNTDLPPAVLGDITLSNMKFSSEAADGKLFRVTMQAPTSKAERFVVVEESGQLKILSDLGKEVGEIGREVLDRLATGREASAKTLLDWAREPQSKGGGDDPLSGPLFPRLWTKGQAADKAAMEYAAAALLIDSKLPSTKAAEIFQRGVVSAPANQQTIFNLALAREYVKEKKWKEASTYAAKVLQAEPLSDTAFYSLTFALEGVKDWAEWEKAAKARLAALPEDLVAIRSLARLAEAQGDFQTARKIMKPMIDGGRATSDDMNTYAWEALFLKVQDEDVEIAQRALNQEKNSFPIMHTLGCLFAQTAKYQEAKNLLLESMKPVSLDEPDSAIWLGMGLLAEQYGEADAAKAAYARVEKPKDESVTSSYALAALHLKSMASTSKTSSGGN